MKKLLLVFALLLSFNSLFASHLAGGEIWYEYAGTAQHPNRYGVYVIIYRDVSGVAMCPSYCPIDICIKSSCFADINVTAPLYPFNITPSSDTIPGSYPGSIILPNTTQCVISNSPGLVYTEAYRFYTQVDLPGTCSDFTFSCSESSRNSSSNLVGQGYFHISAKLNNTFGHNSSARFLNVGAASFCAGVPTIWQQRAFDQDGDSLYYELGHPLDGACNTPSIINYVSGYSANNPITTKNGINLDHRTGVMSFTPTQPEIVVINLRVKEYRYNNNFWHLVSSIMRDVQVPVVSNGACSATPHTWFNVMEPSSNDTTSTLKCNESIIELAFEEDILTNTIAPDGSDFALLNSQGTILPILAVSFPTNLSQTRKVKLHLNKPIEYNDTMALTIRIGSDLNTLQTICNNAIPKGDSLMLHVTGCNTSITLAEPNLHRVNLYPNPAKDHLSFVNDQPIRGKASVEITDYSGKVVMKKSNHSLSEDINISVLSAGGYFVRLYTSQWMETLRFEKL